MRWRMLPAVFEKGFPMRKYVLYPLQFELIRCVGVGGLTTAMYLSIFLGLNELLGAPYLLALGVAFVPSFATGFVLQKFWTFKSADRAVMQKQLFLYSLKKAVFFGINSLALHVLVEWYAVRASIAQVALTLVLGLLSYLVLRLIFRKESR